jgi:hypothetical protein
MSPSCSKHSSSDNIIISSIVDKASVCQMSQDPLAYAAVESMWYSGTLASATRGSMKPCFREGLSECASEIDEIASTVMVVLESRKFSKAVVHIVENSVPSPHVLHAISSFVLPAAICLVVSTSSVDGSFRLYTDASSRGVSVPEGRALEVAKAVLNSKDSTSWYWSLRVLSYSPYLQSEDSGAWLYTIDTTSNTAYPLYESSSNGEIIIPFLYTSSSTPSIVVVNTGVPTMMSCNDLKVEMTALSKLPIYRVHRTGVSTGRCFCCQYLLQAYKRLTDTEQGPQIFCPVKLSKEFFQEMKKRSTTKR